MKKNIFLLFVFSLFISTSFAQKIERPKLFVGIVVDQMREDFLFRFYDQYSEDGFKRLIREGFVCRNVHLNYLPSVTAVGHATIWSGTTPRYHGIVGNGWYDRQIGKTVYAADDHNEQIVGNGSEKGTTTGISTRNLLASNLPDELKICTNHKSKVISISIKDRAAALSAGHTPDGVYWLDLITGNFVSSTFFTDKLPEWVSNFNSQKYAHKYLEKPWELLLSEDQYPFSLDDENPYEEIMGGKKKSTFPYNLKEMAPHNNPYFEVLNRSPWGNSIINDLAIEAIKHENLGKSNAPDLLQISFSSTDPIGHTYGPLSKEINDTYLRLDLEIAKLLKVLDENVGEGNYTIFLSADHGVGEVPQYLKDINIPSGIFSTEKLVEDLDEFLNNKFGKEKWILTSRNEMIYLNRSLINEKGMNLTEVQNLVSDYIKDYEGVMQVFTASQLDKFEYTQNFSVRVQNGFNYNRSGDVKFILEPGWYSVFSTAATHNSFQNHDTHIPLIFFGAGIPVGESFEYHTITDVAPTVSMILKIKIPNVATGRPIVEMLNKLPETK